MTDFLLELRSEEIPARMQDGARDSLARLFTAELAKAGLAATAITTYATPRRLVLIARDLPAETQAVSEEVKGPRASAPPQALEGFLRKTGLSRDQLTERDGVLFAVTNKPGRATAHVLAEAIPAIIRAFPWPKSMRWGAASSSTESMRWVRPLHGIVALFGEDIVEVEVAGIRSGAATLGHRFHHPGPITIGGAQDYIEKLRACHVIVDQEERQSIIALGSTTLAAKAGLTLVRDEGLLAENAGLTEWPVPLLGRFDAAFLDVPPEVIQLTARMNQKYFVCRTFDPPRASLGEGDYSAQPDGGGAGAAGGTLANAFICTANIDATDGGARIIEGNRKVLAARLADARFFYEQDLKVPLEEQAQKLSKIVFHEKLGTVADKVDRVAKLARWLVEEGIIPLPAGEGESRDSGGGVRATGGAHALSPLGADAPHPSPDRIGAYAALAERAARLCKADLVTGMVGEFPELQGIMGGYYATAQGEDPKVAAAIRDHYKPVGQGDEVPTAPVTVAVSLADKLDTLNGFFGVGEVPTGSRDPFALRRAALGVVRLMTASGLRLPLLKAYLESLQPYVHSFVYRSSKLRADVDARSLSRAGIDPTSAFDAAYVARMLDDPEVVAFAESFGKGVEVLLEFFADRLKVQQREAGVRHDLIDAVFALGGEDDLVRLLARVCALQSFITTEDGANLLTGYRRAANILKKEGWSPSTPLPAGEGGARSAEPSGRVGAAGAPIDHPHPSAAAPLPPSPAGRGNIPLSYTPENDEAALHAALDAAEPAAADAVAREEFEGAMAALATLRAPIDAFFDSVTVNDPDPAKRAARLALLARVRDAVHTVADFSRIEG